MRRTISIPSVTLHETLESLANPNRGTSRPSPKSLPRFHENVFVRMLAAKPKMDLLTRRLYPSTILNKVGLNENKEVGAVSRDSVVKGPRIWISASPTIKAVPISGSVLMRKSSLPIPKPSVEREYGARRVLSSDIKSKLDNYTSQTADKESSVPIICTVSVTDPTNTSSLPINLNISDFPELQSLNLPKEIDNRPAGLHLVGALFKYIYIYRPQSA